MAGPWEDYAAPAPPSGPWEEYNAPERTVVERGAILPQTKYSDGKWEWDIHSGVPGAIINGLTAPGRAYRGEMPMNERNPETGESRTSEQAVSASRDTAALGGINAPPGARSVGMGSARRPEPPTGQELIREGGRQMDQVRGMGVDYKAQAVGNMAQGVRQELINDGVLPEIAPSVHRILDRLTTPPEGGVANWQGIEAARKAFNPGNFTTPTEQMAAKRVQAALDRMVTDANPADVLAGPAADAGRLWSEARQNYAAGKRSEKISGENYSAGLGISERAAQRADAANSGQNLDNTLRSRVTSLLQNPRAVAGFNEEERAALRSFVEGDVTRNTLRKVGNILGGGGGMGAAVSGLGGAMVGNQVAGLPGMAAGVVPPLVGMAAKGAQNRAGQKALDAVDVLVRSRAPMANRQPSFVDPRIETMRMRGLLSGDYDGR